MAGAEVDGHSAGFLVGERVVGHERLEVPVKDNAHKFGVEVHVAAPSCNIAPLVLTR